jgi:hypothetical protein
VIVSPVSTPDLRAAGPAPLGAGRS